MNTDRDSYKCHDWCKKTEVVWSYEWWKEGGQRWLWIGLHQK
ncbi:hypothetical protein [Candidatus Hodgkinia cicadicola]